MSELLKSDSTDPLECAGLDLKVKLCKTKGAISVKSDKVKKLNLEKIKVVFKEKPNFVVLDTPIMIIINYDGEIIVHDYGELLFKDLRDENKIRIIAAKIIVVGS